MGLLALFGFGPHNIPVEKAQKYEARADSCIDSGDTGLAIGNYRKAAQVYFYRDRMTDFQRVMDKLRFLSLQLDREGRDLLERHLTDTGRLHYEQGKKLDYKDKVHQAVKEYKLALEFWPDNPKIYCNLGYDYGLLGDADRELVCYQRAVKLEPRYQMALDNLLISYLEQNREGDARVFLAKELNLSEDKIDRLIANEKNAMRRAH